MTDASDRPVQQRLPVEPDADGIAQVRHDLGTEQVRVDCETGDGIPVGYLAMTVISPDEVEITTVPGSGVSVAVVSINTPR